MKLGVSHRRNAMVSFARCAGALSCWKMKKSLDIPQIAGSIFSINRTFLYYSPLTFTPGSTNNNSVRPSFETATETISERLKSGESAVGDWRQRCASVLSWIRRDDKLK